ncbi:HXXEE domain-containing protein [Bradyrhizobium sp. 83012]|uniref:HXXEE domain-containing protein n=1 Tax=Bradyrhizobium aeschynomenes TaxID=2734909 RepID=A0ABX2CCZ8_9BRAD|nr:HXXEE domain-containing protein [Bradyrhizobium aeschynomenes]NPU66094.1 HXXEE domain-containing protein [Bradyrhizobium aeschynomenes]
MTLTTWAWLALAAYGAHILEEYTFDWRNWARAVMKLPVEWSDFYVTNALVVVLGAVQAELAATWPLAPLAYAALMMINALFFHVLPFVRSGGRFSPGLATALVLFFPVAIAMWRRAWSDGLVDGATAVAAIVAGALLMAYPVVLLNLRSKSYFRQDRP